MAMSDAPLSTSTTTPTKRCGESSPSNTEEDESGQEKEKAMEHHDDENNNDDDDDEPSTPTLESGPKFHIDERVLVTDSQQRGNAAPAGNVLPPLYQAIVRKSGLKFVDSTTGLIMPERKKSRSRRRHNQHHHHHNDQQEASQDGIQEWCHLIHFQGWNSRWDVWLTERDVFHNTPENRERVGGNTGKVARAPAKPKEEKNKKRGRPKQEAGEGGDGLTIEGYGKEGGILGQNLQVIAKSCTLPFTLQTKLVDDRDKINMIVYPPPSFNCNDNPWERRNSGITMLHVLPATMNIIGVLAQYVRVKKGEDLEEFAREQERLKEMEEKQQQQQQQSMQEKAEAGNNECDKEKNNQDKTSDSVVEENKESKQQQQSSQSDYSSSKITTKEILKLKKKGRKQFAHSIVALVDISLPLFLLYREERGQFINFMRENADVSGSVGDVDENEGNSDDQEQGNKHKRPSEVYGAEFLLRFFVKLPFILSQYCPPKKVEEMIANNNNEEEDDPDACKYILASVEQSREFADHISELVVFLQKHLDCFKGKYSAVKASGCNAAGSG